MGHLYRKLQKSVALNSKVFRWIRRPTQFSVYDTFRTGLKCLEGSPTASFVHQVERVARDASAELLPDVWILVYKATGYTLPVVPRTRHKVAGEAAL